MNTSTHHQQIAEIRRLHNQLEAAKARGKATKTLLTTAIVGLCLMVISLAVIVINAGLAETL